MSVGPVVMRGDTPDDASQKGHHWDVLGAVPLTGQGKFKRLLLEVLPVTPNAAAKTEGRLLDANPVQFAELFNAAFNSAGERTSSPVGSARPADFGVRFSIEVPTIAIPYT